MAWGKILTSAVKVPKQHKHALFISIPYKMNLCKLPVISFLNDRLCPWRGGISSGDCVVVSFIPTFDFDFSDLREMGTWDKKHCRCRWLSGAHLDRPDFKELFLLPAVGQDLEVAFANALFKSSSDEFLVISEPLTCAIFSLTC